MQRGPIYCHRIESGELMMPSVELPDYAKALDLNVHDLIDQWLTLDASGLPIPKRADARRNNRVHRADSVIETKKNKIARKK
jgi:hypothetical protein